MSERVARFKPGDNVSGFAVSQVEAGRFVDIVGSKTPQGDYPIEHASAGGQIFGVAEQKSLPTTEPVHAQGRRVNVARIGTIASVEAGGVIVAGDPVEVGTGGKAINNAALVASVVIGEDDLAIVVTADTAGAGGNDVTIALVDPNDNDQTLAVTETSGDIVVDLATDGDGEITSTVGDVIDAVNGDQDSAALVTLSLGDGADPDAVVEPVTETNLEGGVDAGSGPVVGRALSDGDDGDFVEVAIK